MKVAVWRTGHEIADTVASAIQEGLPDIAAPNVGIGYGILRGMTAGFKQYPHWFNVDRGYWKPSHYNGYYRISLRSTQQTFGLDKLKPDYDRLRALGIELYPWRGFDDSKSVLVCPPTHHVSEFFGLGQLWKYPSTKCILRNKGDASPINFDDYNYVYTFNSSVGWQALAAGIPCISDPKHSIIGAWFGNSLTDSLSKKQHTEREQLFAVMSGLQLTLKEMREGKLWPLMSQLMSLSDGIQENPLDHMSPLTA